MEQQEIKKAIESRFGARLEEWKKEYGAIKGYGTEGKIAVFRVADIKIIDACRTVSRGSAIGFDDAMLENCWLAGDDELRTVDRYKLGIFNWLDRLIEIVPGEMVEL
jgi:hypothetical protein